MKQLSLLLILAALAGCFGVTPEKTGKEGKPMPEFKILMLDSTTWLNSRNIPAGKPVVLFYYSPYCPYCRAQTQEIVEEMDQLKNIQFYFISSFPIPVLKEYKKVFQLTKFPNIINAYDTSRFAKDYFDPPGIPYMAIYSRNKRLNKSFLGKISANQIKEVAKE